MTTLLTVLDNPTWNSVPQNGPAFTVLSGNPFPAISSVTSTSGPGKRVHFQWTLFINWVGMSYHTGDTVSVSFESPLPPALPLFVSGLTGFGFFGWWRKRKNETI